MCNYLVVFECFVYTLNVLVRCKDLINLLFVPLFAIDNPIPVYETVSCPSAVCDQQTQIIKNPSLTAVKVFYSHQHFSCQFVVI